MIIEFNGERKTIAQWADSIGLGQDTLWVRLYRLGWSIEKAITEPVRIKNGLRNAGHQINSQLVTVSNRFGEKCKVAEYKLAQ